MKGKNIKEANKIKTGALFMLEKRINELKITRYKISKDTGISESTLSRFFNNETDLTLLNFFKICKAVEINPYFLPEEYDTSDIPKFYRLQNEYVKNSYLNED